MNIRQVEIEVLQGIAELALVALRSDAARRQAQDAGIAEYESWRSAAGDPGALEYDSWFVQSR